MKTLFLSLSLILPTLLFAGTQSSKFILAASDFQAKSDAEGAQIVSDILERIKADGSKNADAVLFCGDYSVHFRKEKSESGIAALTQALTTAGLGIEPQEILLVQGNHDPIGTQGLAKSGGHDPAHNGYGIFVINEDDYMWLQGQRPTDGNPDITDDIETVKRTASSLNVYLSEKRKQRFKGPIFVISHLPLHYSMRTFNDGDCRYAKYIFDVLNHHGNAGLNIIFLYGHNHSNGWDNYLGGGSVFLRRGEKIHLSRPENQKKCVPYTLAFTYMNAGYTGYFSTTDANDGANRTLSFTLFEITPSGSVSAKRYSKNGACALKARGVPNTRENSRERQLNLYRPNENTVGAAHTISSRK